MDIQEKTLPAISVGVGDASESIVCKGAAREICGYGAKGLIGVAVVERESTAKMREMYNTVLGEGMGELEAATRRTCGLGEEPVGGVLSQESGAGERAKLGIRKPSTEVGFGGVGFNVPSIVRVGVLGATWCMPDVPLSGLLLLLPELQRPQMGRSGLPCLRSSYHTH